MSTESSGGGRPSQRAGLLAARDASVALGRNMVRNLALWNRMLLRPPRASVPPVSKTAIAAGALTLAVVVAAMFLIDAAAVNWARGMTSPVHDAFEQITNAGLSGWWLVPSGVAVLCLASICAPALPLLTRGVLVALAARLAFVFWAIAWPGLFTAIIKRIIGRARPYMDVHGDPFTYAPFSWHSEFASLPSGHCTTAAAAAVAIGALWPRGRPLIWLYAFTIIVSRVIVLAHHPSDAIAGGLVGVVGAELVRRSFAARRLVFSPRNLEAYPGPSLRRVFAAIHRAVLALSQGGSPAKRPRIEPGRDAL